MLLLISICIRSWVCIDLKTLIVARIYRDRNLAGIVHAICEPLLKKSDDDPWDDDFVRAVIFIHSNFIHSNFIHSNFIHS